MTTVDHDMLIATLDRLKLTAIRDQLDTLLDEAARSKMNLREALGFLVSREIARRDERRISMSSKLAQFPFVRELDGFDYEAQPSLDQEQIRKLRPAAGSRTVTRFCSWGRPERANASCRQPRPRGDPPELQRAVHHGGHAGGDAGQGSCRQLARQAVDAPVAAETAHHRRTGLSAFRGQRCPFVLPSRVAALREGIDPDHLQSLRRRMGERFWRSRCGHGDPGSPSSSLHGDYHSRRQLPSPRKAPVRPSAEDRTGARNQRNEKPMKGSVLQFAV